MFLKHKSDSELIEILDIKELINPFSKTIIGRSHVGEEMQDPASFKKEEFIFPSGETLPKCWVDPDYRKKM